MHGGGAQEEKSPDFDEADISILLDVCRGNMGSDWSPLVLLHHTCYIDPDMAWVDRPILVDLFVARDEAGWLVGLPALHHEVTHLFRTARISRWGTEGRFIDGVIEGVLLSHFL